MNLAKKLALGGRSKSIETGLPERPEMILYSRLSETGI
jgi:hypothetical protein